MTLVFILLLVKRFVTKYSTFWALMIGCWLASVYAVCRLIEDLKWLWYENRIYVLGYVLVVGLLSFAVCYNHGPLVDKRSINLVTWTLQLLALLLIHSSVNAPWFSYAVMMLLLSSRSLRYPLKAFRYMRWCVSFLFHVTLTLSSGFIYCSGKFFGCVIFNLIINYVSPRDFPLRRGEDRELKLLIPSPFPLFVNLLEAPPVTR